MIRQRVNLRTPALAYLVRALTVLGALAMVWYGLMVVLLAVKVAPHTVNSLSAYRTLYHAAADLKASDFTTTVRIVGGLAGLLAFLVFLGLAFQELPRPYLARTDLSLSGQERGKTTVRPRAIERLAELAAETSPLVSSASGRLGDHELNVNITTRRPRAVADTLTDVHQRVRTDLARHDLPPLPVNVTLAGHDQTTRRELS